MMGALREVWRRIRSLRGRQELESGLEDEIRFHVDQQTEKNRRAGMPSDEARRQALIRFGGVERAREQTRDEFRAATLENLARDFRFGWRALLRAPGFTAVVVLTLALGIGATTAMFTVVDGVLLRPLPYPDQERLIEIVHEVPSIGIEQYYASPAIYFGYRDHNRTFDAVGHWDWDSSPVTVTGGGEPESVPSLEMTHEVLQILGATPILGRGFSEADDRPGSAPTAIISHGYWQRRFGGTNPIGRTLTVEGVPRQIIGVLPQSFRFFDYDADIYYLLQHVRADARFPGSDGRAIARLKNGVTLEEANADVARMIPLLWDEFNGNANANGQRTEFRPKLRRLKDTVVGDLGETLWILMGTIALLLLIACANVANLVLVRTHARRAELVLRSALGAGWAAVARIVLTESALVGLLGGVAGVIVAYLTLPLLLSLGAGDLPQIMAISLGRTALLVAAGLAVITTLLVAAAPVVQLVVRGPRHADALRGRAIGDGPEGQRTRQLLVVAQVAIALILLVGSGLMIRTFYELRQVDPGFGAPEGVQTFQVTLPQTGTLAGEAGAANRARLLRTQQSMVERLSAIAGVESAGLVSFNDGLPLDGDGRTFSIVPYLDGRQAADGLARLWEMQSVSPGFFEAMQTTIVAGRSFDWNDVVNQRPVMLVSENLARAEWGSASAAVGRRISPRPDDPGAEVVGVVKDVHHNGVNHPAPLTFVTPARATPTASFVVRSARAGRADFVRDLQRAVWSVSGDVSLARVQTLGDMYRRTMARASMTLLLLGITAGLALVLGVIGIYGVVSYAVSQRRREIGVRMALGASKRDVLRMFVRRALVLVGIGVAVGLGAAAALTRLMASQLFGVSPLDPPTHLAVVLSLVTAAGLASYLSAQRGTGANPLEVLRSE
jgi:putative ABC transport system permease protein